MEWQPIETAPRDGTSILTWTFLDGAMDEYCVMYWSDEREWTCLDTYYLDPTHWMPLPNPPKEDDKWKCPINVDGCTRNCGSYGCGN